MSLEGCTVAGLLHGDGYLHPSVSTSLWAANCELDDVELSGGGTSQLTDCDFLVADISGYFEYEYTGVQDVRVTSCTGDTVHVGTVATFHSDGSTFDAVRLHGGLHALPEIWAQDSSLGDLLLTEHCGSVSLVCCDLASLRFDAAEYGSDWFRVTGCAVRGPMQLDVPGLGGRIIHNTILGDFEYADASWGWPHQFQSNIVTGAASIAAEDPLVASHNDFVGDVFIVADGDSVVANMSEPPLFCGEPDDLTLQDCSLCVGSAHDGGDIGAFSVGCECAVAIERSSWGGIKGLYR